MLSADPITGELARVPTVPTPVSTESSADAAELNTTTVSYNYNYKYFYFQLPTSKGSAVRAQRLIRSEVRGQSWDKVKTNATTERSHI